MRSRRFDLGRALLVAGLFAQTHLLSRPAVCAAPPRTHVVALNGQSFTLPVGFEIEVAASSELSPRPITADFDDQGRLYVADSTGTNEDVEQQIKHPPHR